MSKTKRVGLISDTHNLIRPEVLEALKGSDLIIHAGDVGGPEAIRKLEELAPVEAVKGNCDRGSWTRTLSITRAVKAAGVWLYVLHNLAELDLDPVAAGFKAVIYGHSHKPVVTRRGGVLYVNPGSAGPRRFNLPVTVATLTVDRAGIEAEIVQILKY